MQKISIEFLAENCSRLKKYLNSLDKERIRSKITNHWEYHLNKTYFEINKDNILLNESSGHGLDSSYTGNFTDQWNLANSIKDIYLKFMKSINLPYAGFPVDPLTAFEQLWESEGYFNREFIEKNEAPPYTRTKCTAYNYANELFPFIRNLKINQKLNVIEIGPGSGNLLKLVRNAFKDSLIFIVDLPESIPFSFVNLIYNFHDAEYLLPNEVENLDPDKIYDIDFIFLSPDQINLFDGRVFDVAINTASFGEMLFDEVSNYFDFLRKHCRQKNIFYCVNRVEKWMNYPGVEYSSNKLANGMPIRFHEYPWLENDHVYSFKVSRFHQFFTKQPLFSKIVQLDIG